MCTKKLKTAPIICTLALVAGCGGGGSDGDESASYGTMNDAAYALETKYADADWRLYVPDGVDAGSATYKGYVGGYISDVDVDYGHAIGKLTMDVDFADDTLSGDASNFRMEDDSAIGGTLSLTGGVIPYNNGVDAATLVGTLSGDLEFNAVTYATDIDLIGGFLGGAADDTATIPDAVAGYAVGGGNTLFFDGGFIAER